MVLGYIYQTWDGKASAFKQVDMRKGMDQYLKQTKAVFTDHALNVVYRWKVQLKVKK